MLIWSYFYTPFNTFTDAGFPSCDGDPRGPAGVLEYGTLGTLPTTRAYIMFKDYPDGFYILPSF